MVHRSNARRFCSHVAPLTFFVSVTMPSLVSARECTGGSCTTMRSCEQAVYEDYVCGDSRLDRDGDGIPCEKLCTLSSVEGEGGPRAEIARGAAAVCRTESRSPTLPSS